MAATETIQLPLYYKAPEFTLSDPRTGNSLSLDNFSSYKGLLFIFMCNHCPYVKHVIHTIIDLAHRYQPQGIGFIAINSNDVTNYPDDRPELMAAWANELNFPFPYLYDETQMVAKAYYAACTPDFSLFDAERNCIYRGQLDGSRPGNGIPSDGNQMINAFEKMLNGKHPITPQIPSIGCNIKWKK